MDKTCEDYHRQQGVVVRSDLPYVVICSNLVSHTGLGKNATNGHDEVIDTRKALI